MLSLFNEYPEEVSIIGRLLAGYGELEFGLLCLLTPLMPTPASAMKILFRSRGEEQRIVLADAIIRDQITESPFRERYSEAIADLGYCKAIRNQYAHCHWSVHPTGGLSFNDLEATAKSRGLNPLVHFRPIDPTLLTAQAFYFEFVAQCLAHLSGECEKLAGKTPSHPRPWPKKIERPPLHNA